MSSETFPTQKQGRQAFGSVLAYAWQPKTEETLVLIVAPYGLQRAFQGCFAVSLWKEKWGIHAEGRQTTWIRWSRGLWSWTSPWAQTISLASVCPKPRKNLGSFFQALVHIFSQCLRFRGFSPAAFYSPSIDTISQSALDLSWISSVPSHIKVSVPRRLSPWSQWGQGMMAQRGKCYIPARDHIGHTILKQSCLVHPVPWDQTSLKLWPLPGGVQVVWAKTMAASAQMGWVVLGGSWNETHPHSLLENGHTQGKELGRHLNWAPPHCSQNLKEDQDCNVLSVSNSTTSHRWAEVFAPASSLPGHHQPARPCAILGTLLPPCSADCGFPPAPARGDEVLVLLSA